MPMSDLIALLTRHVNAACESGDIAAADALSALVEDMPLPIREAVDEATC